MYFAFSTLRRHKFSSTEDIRLFLASSSPRNSIQKSGRSRKRQTVLLASRLSLTNLRPLLLIIATIQFATLFTGTQMDDECHFNKVMLNLVTDFKVLSVYRNSALNVLIVSQSFRDTVLDYSGRTDSNVDVHSHCRNNFPCSGGSDFLPGVWKTLTKIKLMFFVCCIQRDKRHGNLTELDNYGISLVLKLVNINEIFRIYVQKETPPSPHGQMSHYRDQSANQFLWWSCRKGTC